MKGNKKVQLAIGIISFIMSLITSLLLSLKLRGELNSIPSKEEDYIPKF